MVNNPMVVRVCSAQINSIWEDPEQTLEKAGPLIRHAAASGASLICFPEQFATGWDPVSVRNIQDTNGSIVSGLRRYAELNHICVIGSFREGGLQKPRNTAIVIDQNGRISGKYSKIHLFSPGNEQSGYEPGTSLGLFSVGPLACGIAICYDLRFPEIFRLYAGKGVQVVFVPAAWPAQRMEHWKLFIAARAAENQLYVVGVNTTGKTPVDSYAGSSMTADPCGTIISRAGEAEQLVFSDIDPAGVKTARHRFPVENDRKDALYRTLSKDTRRI